MKEITSKDRRAAWIQWIPLFLLDVFAGVILGGLVVYPIVIIWLKIKHQLFHMEPKPNEFGELTENHKEKYIAIGAFGLWEYWDVSSFFFPFNKIFWPWGNSEDGFLGEPSGKHSARNDGKERSFMGMYRWSMRNHLNNIKRIWLGCPIDDCDIIWEGDGLHRNHAGHIILNDNDPVREGEYFTKATHRETGKVYYGYRLVKALETGKIKHIRYGFKIKPRHAIETQDADDKLKGFSMTYTRWANAN